MAVVHVRDKRATILYDHTQRVLTKKKQIFRSQLRATQPVNDRRPKLCMRVGGAGHLVLGAVVGALLTRAPPALLSARAASTHAAMSFAAPPRSLSREEVRAVDEKAIGLGLPGIVLMENAALGLTKAVVAELARRGKATTGAVVGIVAKTGNNGGDGFVLARQLLLQGYKPRVAYCGDLSKAKRETDAGINLSVIERMAGIDIVEVADGAQLSATLALWADAELLVDCLYGTGLAAQLRPDAVALVEALDAAPQPKIACDLPSGLDCDTGLPLGAAVRAVRTVTFVGRKKGFDEAASAAYTGEVEVVPIGCPEQCWDHVA